MNLGQIFTFSFEQAAAEDSFHARFSFRAGNLHTRPILSATNLNGDLPLHRQVRWRISSGLLRWMHTGISTGQLPRAVAVAGIPETTDLIRRLGWFLGSYHYSLCGRRRGSLACSSEPSLGSFVCKDFHDLGNHFFVALITELAEAPLVVASQRMLQHVEEAFIAVGTRRIPGTRPSCL